MITGGYGNNDQEPTNAELYDPVTGLFTPAGSMTTVQGPGPATLLADGRVFVTGVTTAEIYDPTTGTFAPTGAYVDATPLLWESDTLLLDGSVLLTGCTADCSAEVTELFDPKSGMFSRTGPWSDWEYVDTPTLLASGKVLFVGSIGGDATPADAEIYDPASGTFTYLGTTAATHDAGQTVRLNDGTVLITGGQLAGGDHRRQ